MRHVQRKKERERETERERERERERKAEREREREIHWEKGTGATRENQASQVEPKPKSNLSFVKPELPAHR